MKTIWKFPLVLGSLNEFAIPRPATPLFIGTQLEKEWEVCVWCEIEDDREPVRRIFAVHGTGHQIGDNERHVGSVQVPPFVWHVYEVIS